MLMELYREAGKSGSEILRGLPPWQNTSPLQLPSAAYSMHCLRIVASVLGICRNILKRTKMARVLLELQLLSPNLLSNKSLLALEVPIDEFLPKISGLVGKRRSVNEGSYGKSAMV